MSRRGRVIANIVVCVALAAVVGPLLWVLRVALRPQVSFLRDPAGLGGGWTLHNLADAWSIGGLGHALWNSTLVVVPGAALATALAAMAGWGLAGYRFPGRSAIAGVMVAVILVPLAALVMPLFDQGVRLDLVGHRWWLSIVYGTVFAAWGTLFLRPTCPKRPLSTVPVRFASSSPSSFRSPSTPSPPPSSSTCSSCGAN